MWTFFLCSWLEQFNFYVISDATKAVPNKCRVHTHKICWVGKSFLFRILYTYSLCHSPGASRRLGTATRGLMCQCLTLAITMGCIYLVNISPLLMHASFGVGNRWQHQFAILLALCFEELQVLYGENRVRCFSSSSTYPTFKIGGIHAESSSGGSYIKSFGLLRSLYWM